MNMSVDQALRKARQLARDGALEEAAGLCNDLIARFPGNRRAMAELHALTKPRIENPPTAQMDAVIALHTRGLTTDALAEAVRLLARYPNGEILLNLTGALYAATGHLDEAIAHYDRAIALAPDYVEAYSNRGNALKDVRRTDEALASFDEAIRLKPDYAAAHVNRGIVLYRTKRLAASLASYDRAIGIDPTSAEAYMNRGNVLRELRRFDDSLADFDRALALRPGHAETLVNRGGALKEMQRMDEALDSYDSAIAIAPHLPEAHFNRGTVLKYLKRPEEALEAHRRALALRPGYGLALSEAINLRAQMCLWDGEDEISAQLASRGESDVVLPFHMLHRSDDPAVQLDCARAWTRETCARVVAQPFAPRVPGDRIRIGYFSADFHGHATMYLMARLFELHDRDRFEIHAFSYGGKAQDSMRQRLLDTVHAFHDVAELDDAAIAALAREQRIDIAVDLKGWTETTRARLFAYRAAPVQLAYLGYPGTTGADFMDYILADEVIIPPGHEAHYAEKVVRLPQCYQVNDDRRKIADRIFARAELGLPERGFVFCCFNNNYKISPAEFDIWMRLLARVEGSVLWLLEDNRWAAANLRREAEARGIAADRLVFAPRMPLAEHLARHACADLFLDTFKVNAHTTTSDALWAGLPVLTKLGGSFAARVAGSLLHAVGLPEMATETVEQYETLALDLATDPVRLAAVRERLAANRLTAPLFDTERTTRAIEAVYELLVAPQG